jgi:hypothetical protein
LTVSLRLFSDEHALSFWNRSVSREHKRTADRDLESAQDRPPSLTFEVEGMLAISFDPMNSSVFHDAATREFCESVEQVCRKVSAGCDFDASSAEPCFEGRDALHGTGCAGNPYHTEPILFEWASKVKVTRLFSFG